MHELNEINCLSIERHGGKFEKECGLVRATAGSAFKNNSKLQVMNYSKSIAREEKKDGDQAVIKEHNSFCKYQVWKAVPKSKVPKGAKVLTSTWAMKHKPNGVNHARLNACGFKQVDGLHYNGQNLSAPAMNDITIRIVFVIIILAAWTAELLDVKGAFLNG
eukprot:11187619-Ditylum_brightwellii.AAC.1